MNSLQYCRDFKLAFTGVSFCTQSEYNSQKNVSPAKYILISITRFVKMESNWQFVPLSRLSAKIIEVCDQSKNKAGECNTTRNIE